MPCDELTRLAGFLSLDPAGLVAEFQELRAVADRVRQSSSCSNASAWAAAVRDTQATAKRKAQYPVDNLLPALRRYVVYSGSSAGVEQCFSKMKFYLGEHRNFNQQGKQRVLVLSSSKKNATTDVKIVGAARWIWACNFGAPRAKRQAALPDRLQILAQRQKRKAEHPHCLASKQLRRRTALDMIAHDPGLPTLADRAKVKAKQLHTEKHAAELQRQMRVRASRRLDAALDGTFASGGGIGLADDVIEKHRQQRKNRSDNFWKQRARKLMAQRGDRNVNVAPGTTVFVETAAWEPALGTVLTLRRCRRVDDRVLADIWVAQDPAKPCRKTQFCAGMKGGLVVSPAWWHAPPGIAVQYRRALALTRRVFVSDSCASTHPDGIFALRRLVELGRCAATGSHFRIERDWDTFRARASGRSNKAGRKEYVALLTSEEIDQEPYRALPSVCRHTFSDFVRGIVKVLPSRGLRLAGRTEPLH